MNKYALKLDLQEARNTVVEKPATDVRSSFENFKFCPVCGDMNLVFSPGSPMNITCNHNTGSNNFMQMLPPAGTPKQ